MSNAVFPNEVLENKLNSILLTKVDMNAYITADTSLASEAGMKKKINKYKAVGQVEEVAKGEGNTESFESSYESFEYTVGTTQARGIYYDEEALADPMVVDTIVTGMAEEMVNDFTRKAVAEMAKADMIVECDFSTSTSGYLFDKVVDALAMFKEGVEDLSFLINRKHLAYFRKQLKDELKYSEDFVRTGYVGSVCGVPLVVSDAVPENCAFICNKEAVTAFLKKASEAEQDRDPNLRKNIVYLRKVALVALTDATKLVMLAKAQDTACAITTYTKAAKTIAGTCGEDCYKVIVVDGDGEKYEVEPSSGAWTLSAKENLTAGDKINATAYAYGYAPYEATEVTVAS